MVGDGGGHRRTDPYTFTTIDQLIEDFWHGVEDMR